MQQNTQGYWLSGLVVFALALFGQLALINYQGLGNDDDPNMYRDYGCAWRYGSVPYQDFEVEYPPGAMLVFRGIATLGCTRYREYFAYTMAVLMAITAAWIWLHLLSHSAQRVRTHILGLMVFVLAMIMQTALIYRRFDLVPAFIVVWAALVNPLIPAAFLLGLGGAIKIWPAFLALVPWVYAYASHPNNLKPLVRVCLCTGLGFALPFMFFLPQLKYTLMFLAYHSKRGLEFESSWSVVKMLWDYWTGQVSHVVFHHKSDHLADPSWTSISAFLVFPALISVVGWPLFRWYRYLKSRPLTQDRADLRTDARRHALLAYAAITLGVLLVNRVFSPQFIIWVIPVSALALWVLPTPSRISGSVVLLATSFLSDVFWKNYYIPLRDGPRGVALVVISLRMLGIACLYLLFVMHIRRDSVGTLTDEHKISA